MELDLEPIEGSNFIQSYSAGTIKLNNEVLHHNLIVTHTLYTNWNLKSISDLDQVALQKLLDYDVEVILLGVGEKPYFLKPELIHFVQKHQVGIECMTTAAACRTFNVLLNENRNVLAALLI